jgi:hypothetical protein
MQFPEDSEAAKTAANYDFLAGVASFASAC